MANALDGVSVADLTMGLAGPYCTMLLGDLGAEVIKVEPPERGDYGREGAYGGHLFRSCSRNKKSLTLDLSKEEGKQILHRLIKKSDVFVQSYKPSTLPKLGIDYETLRKINPRLVYCSISGYGMDGPYKERPGFDLVGQAVSGLLYTYATNDSLVYPIALADLSVSMSAVQAILAALIARERTGTGQHVETSLLESAMNLLAYLAPEFFDLGRPIDKGSRELGVGFLGAYLASDSKFLVIQAFIDRIFDRMATIPELKHIIEDPRFRSWALRRTHCKELSASFREVIRTKPRDYWLSTLLQADVPCAPVLRFDEALRDPQVEHRKMIVELKHPTKGTVKNIAPPWKFSETPPLMRLPPPLLGEHTLEILESLGYSRREIDELGAKGVIRIKPLTN